MLLVVYISGATTVSSARGGAGGEEGCEAQKGWVNDRQVLRNPHSILGLCPESTCIGGSLSNFHRPQTFSFFSLSFSPSPENTFLEPLAIDCIKFLCKDGKLTTRTWSGISGRPVDDPGTAVEWGFLLQALSGQLKRAVGRFLRRPPHNAACEYVASDHLQHTRPAIRGPFSPIRQPPFSTPLNPIHPWPAPPIHQSVVVWGSICLEPGEAGGGMEPQGDGSHMAAVSGTRQPPSVCRFRPSRTLAGVVGCQKSGLVSSGTESTLWRICFAQFWGRSDIGIRPMLLPSDAATTALPRDILHASCRAISRPDSPGPCLRPLLISTTKDGGLVVCRQRRGISPYLKERF